MSESEEAAVEAWLDSHPAFFEDYFQRRGSRGLVDGWLRRRFAAASSATSAGCPGAQLAPRSLSCSGGAVSTIGRRSRRIRKASSELHSDDAMPQQRRRQLPALTEEAATACEMMMSSLLMELDSRKLCRRIVRACRLLLAADRCALFLAEPGDPTGCLSLAEDTAAATEPALSSWVRVPLGVGIVGSAAATGQTLRLERAPTDPRFNASTDELPDCSTVRALAAPLKHPDGGIVGLLLATAGAASAAFTDAQEKSLQTFLAYCSASLRNSKLFQESLLETKRNEVLLDLVRITFEHMENLELLVHNILHYMRLISRCTWCQILLIDDPSSAERSFDRVFELQAEGADRSAEGGRLLISSEIVQRVLSSGDPLIISNASCDSRLTPEERSRIRSLLCLPVRNARSEPSGLCLLMNPADGRTFSESDVNLAEAFALFCGLGIHSVRQRELAETAQKRQRVALDVLGYHASAGPDEAQKLARSLVPSGRYFGIDQLAFDEFSLSESDTLLCSIKLFQEAGLLSAFQLDYRVFCRWLLSVHKNYRPVAYHNWRHAFAVTHCVSYLIRASPELKLRLTPLEQLAAHIAALCHDLDHRDPDRIGQRAGLSSLAELYSSSMLERQHFSQCIMLLSLEGCDILARLPHAQYTTCMGLVEKCILAADLQRHIGTRLELERLLKSGGLDWSSQAHRHLMLGLVMTCADLCTFAKPWPQHRRVAQLVTDELRRLSDVENVKNCCSNADAGDRAQHSSLSPELQAEFISSVCLPAFEMLSSFCSDLEVPMRGCSSNMAGWAALAAEVT